MTHGLPFLVVLCTLSVCCLDSCDNSRNVPRKVERQSFEGSILPSEIHDAAGRGDLTAVKALLRDNPDLVFSRIHRTNEDAGNEATPLHAAARGGAKDVAELLLASNAEVDARDGNGRTPLFFAALGDRQDVAKLLLASKADVNARDDSCSTPLILAVYGGHEEMVELLLTSGAEVNAREVGGRTALYLAEAYAPNKEVAKLLRLHGGRWVTSSSCTPKVSTSLRDSSSPFVWPSWLPEYPRWYDAKYSMGMAWVSGGGPGVSLYQNVDLQQGEEEGSFEFETPDSKAQVLSFYATKCEALGMAVKREMASDNLFATTPRRVLIITTPGGVSGGEGLDRNNPGGGVVVRVEYSKCPHNSNVAGHRSLGGRELTEAEKAPCSR
jgi:hypothetical protein